MSAEVITIKSGTRQQEEIQRVGQALRDGALVVFPTETVYGVAANAANADSVERLRNVKGRTDEQPFTVHIGRRQDWQDFVPSVSGVAQRFIKKGWPGPLTLIFPVQSPADAKISGSLSKAGSEAIYSKDGVGIRFPDELTAVNLLVAAGVPIIASSANITGHHAPTDSAGISETISKQVDFILAAGHTRYQKSSTIVALNGGGYRLIRAGVWDERTVRNFANLQILFVCTGNTCRSPMAEGLFKQMVAAKVACRVDELEARGIIIRSAGTGAYGRGKAAKEAVEICAKRGVDISSHSTHGLSLELIQPCDYIYTMTRQHAEAVRAMAPGDAAKIVRLHADDDIADPVGGTLADYEAALVKIEEGLRQRISEVPL